jgi:hypothetical protein
VSYGPIQKAPLRRIIPGYVHGVYIRPAASFFRNVSSHNLTNYQNNCILLHYCEAGLRNTFQLVLNLSHSGMPLTIPFVVHLVILKSPCFPQSHIGSYTQFMAAGERGRERERERERDRIPLCQRAASFKASAGKGRNCV